MVSRQEVQNYQDQLDLLFTGLQNTKEYQKIQQGYPASPDLQAALQAINTAQSRLAPLLNVNTNPGAIADSDWSRAKSAAQSALTQNSDAFRNVYGAIPPMLNNELTGGTANPSEILTSMTGVTPDQYVNPSSGSNFTPATPPPSQSTSSLPFLPSNGEPLPIIPGLSNSNTPVNSPTAPSDISPYVPATSQQQQDIVNQAIQQSQGVAGQNLQQLQGLINPWVQQQFSQYTDKASPGYQSMMGDLNNVGMSDSGAFPQALASRLAPLISQGALDLGKGALLPSFLNQQGLVSSGAANQSTLGLEPLNRFVELQNFNMQKQLANDLADRGASAQLGSGIGGLLGGGLGAYAGSSFGPAGMVAGSILGSQGGQAAGGGLSFICNHLMKLGFATSEEIDAVHDKLWPTIIRHPAEWFAYFMMAPFLISCIDEPWAPIKEELIDAVLAEPDSEAAWQIYRAECQRLALTHAPLLWTLEVKPC